MRRRREFDAAWRRAGFTLIEMMIVIAIIGILAALSMPWYMRFQLRSKAVEARMVLSAMRSAEESYFSEYGTFIDMTPTPVGSPVSTKRTWELCSTSITMSSAGYCIIGFMPEGPTYYTYAVTTGVPAGSGASTEFFADAAGDLDGNGVLNIWGVEVPNWGASAATVDGVLGCDTVYDGEGRPLVGQIGACGVGFGFAVF